MGQLKSGQLRSLIDQGACHQDSPFTTQAEPALDAVEPSTPTPWSVTALEGTVLPASDSPPCIKAAKDKDG